MAAKETAKLCESCERMATAEVEIKSLRGRVGNMESKLDKLFITTLVVLGGIIANFIAVVRG